MNSGVKTIAATTTLSVFIHGVVVAALLHVDQPIEIQHAVGQGMNIELISAVDVTNDSETEIPQQQLSQNKQSVINEHEENKTENKSQITDSVLIVKESKKQIVDRERLKKIDSVLAKESVDPLSVVKQRFESIVDSNSQAVIARSTDANQQQHNILELLHSSISTKKVYPYIAQRQRREGISTIAFTLYPDGRVEQATLLNSSQTIALDNAAISAVQGIEPFEAAKAYLKQAEQFTVDVVFSLN